MRYFTLKPFEKSGFPAERAFAGKGSDLEKSMKSEGHRPLGYPMNAQTNRSTSIAGRCLIFHVDAEWVSLRLYSLPDGGIPARPMVRSIVTTTCRLCSAAMSI